MGEEQQQETLTQPTHDTVAVIQALNEVQEDKKSGFRRLSGSFSRRSGKRNPVHLNVYDLTPMNGYLYWFGVGIFHSGVEAHGVEYGFGAHDFASSGVFEVEPRSCPGFTFRKSVYLGSTSLNPHEFREFVERLANDYNGDSYHLLLKNCNHFTNDVCTRLLGSPIPGWVNRLARIAQLCNCLLPDAVQASTVKQTPEYHSCGEESEEAKEVRPSLKLDDVEDEEGEDDLDELLVGATRRSGQQVRIVENL